MGGTSITRYLPDNEYQAAISANAPTALNPFATIADITGAAQNLQQVLSVGSGATITTNFTVYVFDNTIEFASDNQTSGDVATLLLDSKNPTGAGLLWSDGATGNERFLLINSSSMSIYDDFLKGLVYDADYSAAGVLDDRWIPDYAAVKAYADSVGGIYGGSDFLSVSTTVSLTDGVAANYDLTFATLTEAALVHYDSTNNRVGWGIAVPGHSLHFALGNAYFQNGSVAIGTTVPDSAHKFRVSTDNADGNNYTGARIDLSHDSATGVFQGLQIRSTTTLVGATSTLYGVNSNITGSATAGVHTVIAGRFKAAKTQAGTSTVTNYALQLEDGSEGTVGHVWASDTVTGHGHWVDVNTLVSGGGNTIYTADDTIGSGREATITDTLTFKGGDLILQGASLATEFFFDYSANATVLGNGTADAAYTLKTYGGVNLDDGLAAFDKTPVSNRNISITTQGLATNGTGLYVSNAQTLTGDITVGHFIASGATTTNTALSLRAINGGVNNALSIIAGDISVRQNTTKVLFGITGFLANARFSLINEGTFTTGFDVYSNKTGDNTGYSARGSSASSVGGNQFGFKANNGTGAANNTYAFHGTISAGGATANTANVYGYYLDWNGPGATRTATGLQKGLYFDMRLTAAATETISGDIFGTDILLGTGQAADSIGNVTGHKIRFLDTASSTITKAVGLELDFTSSLATTKYGIILTGSANSGFGVAAPASMVTVDGDVETIAAGEGLIVLDSTNGNRYRIYMDNGTLSSQLA